MDGKVKDPLWCFEDGPAKGTARRLLGRMVIHYIALSWRQTVSVTYKPRSFFKEEDGDLVIIAAIIPQQRKKWARIKRKMGKQ